MHLTSIFSLRSGQHPFFRVFGLFCHLSPDLWFFLLSYLAATIMARLLDTKNIVNLSSFHLTETHISVLWRGLKFCPTPEDFDLRADMDHMHKHLQPSTTTRRMLFLSSTPSQGPPRQPTRVTTYSAWALSNTESSSSSLLARALLDDKTWSPWFFAMNNSCHIAPLSDHTSLKPHSFRAPSD